MPRDDDARSFAPFGRTVSARMRVSIANLIGLLAGVAVGVPWAVALGVLAGGDVAAVARAQLRVAQIDVS